MAKRMVQTKQDRALKKILKILTIEEITSEMLPELLGDLLFSIGFTLEKEPALDGPEAVEIRYGENPTLGNALMAQGMWMKSTWQTQKEELDD